MSITGYLAKGMMEQFERADKIAKAEFEIIDLKEFIITAIEKCIEKSSEEANNKINEKVKYIKNNYFNEEINIEYNKWISQVGHDFREDNTVYRKAKRSINKEISDKKERIEIVINFIEQYILNETGNYQDRLAFVESFEEAVRESILNEVLFEHFKTKEKAKLDEKEMGIYQEIRQETIDETLHFFKVIHKVEIAEHIVGLEKSLSKIIQEELIVDQKMLFRLRRGEKNDVIIVLKAYIENSKESLIDFDDDNYVQNTLTHKMGYTIFNDYAESLLLNKINNHRLNAVGDIKEKSNSDNGDEIRELFNEKEKLEEVVKNRELAVIAHEKNAERIRAAIDKGIVGADESISFETQKIAECERDLIKSKDILKKIKEKIEIIKVNASGNNISLDQIKEVVEEAIKQKGNSKETNSSFSVMAEKLDSIFISEKGFTTFFKLIDKLNLFEQNNDLKRGSRTKFKAILEVGKREEKIFKVDTLQKEYVLFLNKKYSIKLNPNKLPDGGNHEKNIEEIIKKITSE